MIHVYADRDEWLAARRADPTSIGASEVAAILGVSPYLGPWDVWTTKMAGDVADEPDVVTGDDPDAAPDLDNPLDRGNVWEPFVRQLAGIAMGTTVHPPGFILAQSASSIVRVEHDDHPWATCSPDGWAPGGYGAVPVELKTDASRSGWAWGKSGTVIADVDDNARAAAPPHYLTQVWWQLAVTGAPFGYLVVVLGSYRVRWFRIEANADIQRQLLDRVGEWRERHLVRGIEPDRDASEACVRHYRAMYLGADDGERLATDAEAAAIYDLDAARKAGKAAELAARDALSRLLPTMAGATRLRLPDSRASATRDSRGVVRVWGL